MKDKKYTEMSIEELQKSEKSIKMITGLLGGALLVLFIINIVLAFKKGFSAMSAVPVALLPILIININNLKEIKKELELRKGL